MVTVIGSALDEEHRLGTIENVTANLVFWSEHPERCVQLVAESEGFESWESSQQLPPEFKAMRYMLVRPE